jgi:predicted ATPase/class 3 adenylate cyclase
MQLPTGTVTFLFTDVHDSTRLWEAHPAEMRHAIRRHDQIIRRCVDERGGIVVKSTGDGLMIAFADASAAAACAVESQRAIQAEPWPVPIAVRMGLHTGTAHAVDGDYLAPAVNRAARVAAAAHPGQILGSAATAAIVDGVAHRPLGEHQLKGLPAMHLVQFDSPGLRHDFPPLASSAFHGVELPRPLTSFVGRDQSIATVSHLLETHRVVTLTGVGGCGKTRLAIETAARIAPGFADGARFADLAAVTDEARVPPAIATTLGITDSVGSDQIERLAEYVAAHDLLLVLDNCEHLLDPCADLVEAISARAGPSRVLATSREPLAVEGEQILLVAPLDAGTEAVRLFTERARQVRPSFLVDDANRDGVVEICRRLDGMPLAIELAAAQTAHLSVHQLLAGLEDRFRLLVGGRRRVQRQQTLAATLDWSHDLLTVEEQVTLRRLAVFPAAFSLGAADAVVGGGGTRRSLASLTAKSLVDVVDDGEDFRYRLLESVRMYAEEKLVLAGEAIECRDLHRDWVIGWMGAVPLEDRWFGDRDLLSEELPSIRAALQWAETTGDAVGHATMATGFDWARGDHRVEGLAWCERAEAYELPQDVRLQLLAMLAVMKTATLSREGLAEWIDRAVDEAGSEPNPFLAVMLSWHAAIVSVRAVADDDRRLAAAVRATAARVDSLIEHAGPPWQMYCRFVTGMGYASLSTVGLEPRSTAEEYYRNAAEHAASGPPYRALRSSLFEYLSLFRLLSGDAPAALALAHEAPSGEGRWPMFGPNNSASRVLALGANGDPEGARVELRAMHESFLRSEGVHGRETVCMYAGALAAIAQDWERAALLLAAGRRGIHAGAEAALVYYHFRDSTRAALGPRARELRDRGIAMPLDDAIELALTSPQSDGAR